MNALRYLVCFLVIAGFTVQPTTHCSPAFISGFLPSAEAQTRSSYFWCWTGQENTTPPRTFFTIVFRAQTDSQSISSMKDAYYKYVRRSYPKEFEEGGLGAVVCEEWQNRDKAQERLDTKKSYNDDHGYEDVDTGWSYNP